MIIKKLKPDYFGKISGKEIELRPGINLIYGENEAGKSTLHAFIKGMLFGIEKLRGRGAASREDIYSRYLPWDYPGAYGGLMDIQIDEKSYRLKRSFHVNDKIFIITDLDTGREIKLKEGHISEIIPNLTEATFRNTISIEQLKAETDSELAGYVRNYIANLSIAGSREVDVEKAISHLKEKKKSLEAIPYAIRLKTLKEEIEKGIEKEKEINSLTVTLMDFEAERIRITEQLDMQKKYTGKDEELITGLPAILEKYRNYEGLKKQYNNLEKQTKELKDKLAGWEIEVKKGADFKNNLNEVQFLNAECAKCQEKLQDFNKELEEKNRNIKRNHLLYLCISIAASLSGFLITDSIIPAVGLLGVFLITGGIICALSNKNSHTQITVIKSRINEIKKQYKEAESKINYILNKYQVNSLHELITKQEDYIKSALSLEQGKELLSELNDRMKELEDNIDEFHDTIMLYMSNFISEEELTQEAIKRLQDTVNLRKAESEKQRNDLKQRLDNINIQIEKIKWELSNANDDEIRLINNKEEYDSLKQKQKENEVELSAINLAMNTIRELSVNIHDSFGKKLNRAVSDILSDVTEGKYQNINIDENLNVKLEWKDNFIILDRLSAGTINQVYLALRIAVADLLLGKDKMPLILDDSFALYDDKRLKSALLEISGRRQVIIFTCQMREKQLLDELGLPYNFIKL